MTVRHVISYSTVIFYPLDKFSILAHENKKWLLGIKESLLIMRDKTSRNRNINMHLCAYLIKSPNKF